MQTWALDSYFYALRWSVRRLETCTIVDTSNKELCSMAIHLVIKYVYMEHWYPWWEQRWRIYVLLNVGIHIPYGMSRKSKATV